MQKQPPLLAARMRPEHLAPQAANCFQPTAKVLRQLLVDLLAQPLRQRRALTRRRNGDLQLAPAHHRAKEEIAVRNVIHAVAENAPCPRFAIYGRVYLWNIRRCDYDEVPVQIGGLKRSRLKLDLPFRGQRKHFVASLRSNDAQLRPSP